jgi:hypothetical protein
MEFSPEWDYFFKNKGRCPICKHELCPQFGCTYWKCPSVLDILDGKLGTVKRREYVLHKALIDKYWDQFRESIRRKNELFGNDSNLDKAMKKTYIIDSKL